MALTDLRGRISAGDRLIGTFSLIPAMEIIEIIAVAGFDFVIIDMEHGPYDLGTVRDAVVAARASGVGSVVRVRNADPDLIGAVLDIGCDGVLVPQIASASQARSVLRAARFAPDGTRGANPYVRAAGYGSVPDWFAGANRDVAVMLMIEGCEGIAACPEILGLPGLDAVFLGPVDLSHSLGLPGQISHPRVVDALAGIAARATEHGVATAVFAQDADATVDWARRGVQLIARGVDADFIRTGLEKAAAESRPSVKDVGRSNDTSVGR
jgi:4-hydroxy-2-oxoheptanedioate aldolase